ncbi:hypothetical protein FQR65_LT20042 [Abscondita terminalis]|nr:hypothetical protein FQR65_LT20042 [Abscondita terminalis]
MTGKGQRASARARKRWPLSPNSGGVPCVLEAFAALDYEISVVLGAAVSTGASVVFPVARNVHRGRHSWRYPPPRAAREPAQASARPRPPRRRRPSRRAWVTTAAAAWNSFVAQGRSRSSMKSRRARTTAASYTDDACLDQPVRAAGARMAGLAAGRHRPAGARPPPDWAGALATPTAKLASVWQREARRGTQDGAQSPSSRPLAAGAADAAASPRALGMQALGVRAGPCLFRRRPARPRPQGNRPRVRQLLDGDLAAFPPKPFMDWGRTRKTRGPWRRSYAAKAGRSKTTGLIVQYPRRTPMCLIGPPRCPPKRAS